MSRRIVLPTALGAAAALVFAPLAYATTLDVSGTPILFFNDSDLGDDATAGTSERFEDVATVGGTVIDAVVTFVQGSNIDNDDTLENGADNVLDYIDEDPGDAEARNALSPQIDGFEGLTPGQIAYGELRVDFYLDNTTTPVTLSNLSILAKDIDAGQSVMFQNATTYSLSSDPATVLAGSVDGDWLIVADQDGGASSDGDQENWVEIGYSSASSVLFRIRTPEEGSASFDLVFSAAEWDNSPTTFTPDYSTTEPEASSDPEPASSPAIHLDIEEILGAPVGSTPVLFEGEGLARNTPFTLRLGPSGQVLGSGEVDRFGYFSQRVNLPSGLAPGNYYVTLSTTDPAGNPLSLTQSFTVGASGVITSVSVTTPAASGDVLARTGPDSTALAWGVGGLVGLSVVGMALMLAGYAHTTRRPKLAPVVTPQR